MDNKFVENVAASLVREYLSRKVCVHIRSRSNINLAHIAHAVDSLSKISKIARPYVFIVKNPITSRQIAEREGQGLIA